MQEMKEIPVQSLGQKDPLEEEMATHSGILAWRIPCTEEPGPDFPAFDFPSSAWGAPTQTSNHCLLDTRQNYGLKNIQTVSSEFLTVELSPNLALQHTHSSFPKVLRRFTSPHSGRSLGAAEHSGQARQRESTVSSEMRQPRLVGWSVCFREGELYCVYIKGDFSCPLKGTLTFSVTPGCITYKLCDLGQNLSFFLSWL